MMGLKLLDNTYLNTGLTQRLILDTNAFVKSMNSTIKIQDAKLEDWSVFVYKLRN